MGCQAAPTAEPAPASTVSTHPAEPSPTPDPEDAEPVRLTREQLTALIDDPARSEKDRTVDERRKPVDMLAFIGVFEGMKVADIGAGTGYTSELLARAVGPSGRVIGHNTPFVLERFAEAGWTARLQKPVMANVVRVDRPFDDPFGPEITELDAVVNVLFYHDFAWQEVDRAAHNRGVFEALRPGGHYVVIDASAAAGAGATGSKTLHRIEQALVVEEVTAAGFELAGSADFLANPDDTLDWNALPWREAREMYSDKFVLRFQKPGQG